ncbi:SMP-30/gluconolactonase/LRE family protein [Sinorhizobium mexicanum]|uniref:SMP-30/gluconolactonase/LRE family protein n=1 Tax=Sinorhizobium mexicanum TaxID=375549 RepID=A0A859QIQ0_9HYPH|nr:SMP-30/gluconolactonase/LRE family protein [Sinorhizobium mexicanum]MBP1883114.1 sugar lactone lactonase YvrE [Sinorhizobium mexicanum]QLL60757.1 SMP-30/gluconolactonase/LRE family protein [Sinorhizobium mexicanum]
MTDPVPFSGRVLCDFGSELGEGPTFDPGSGTAWWFNITGRELHELHVESGRKTVHTLPFLGSVLAVIDPARQLIASDQGLFLRDTETGKLSLFTTLEDKPVNRSNDGRVHPSGALWIGTMGRKAERNSGAIYHVAGNRVTKLYSNISIPNAICFSPDGATAYFTDSVVNRLMRVDIDPATALPIGDAVILSDESTSPGDVDGAVCDADGLIWNARWGASSVDVYKPDGQRIARYAVPATQPSCPAFIGAKADRLLITSASQGLDEAARAADPDAGKTFDLGIEVKGRFEPAFLL